MANLINCPVCNKQMSSAARACPHCGHPILACPKCGSNNVNLISGAKKGLSAWAFGAFAANTVMNDFQCGQCGHKFK